MARDDYDDEYRYYWSRFPPPSRPREARGGIKSRSKRGGFGESWWAKRWIQVLDGFGIEKRLRRGRSYARRGQVLSINLLKGEITAAVQGSRIKPYDVTIRLKQLSQADWDRVMEAMSREAYFAAKLLAGELPGEIESLFEHEGLSLFPKRLSDLKTDCSCPDWSNPCKHIAAAYYLLAEEFDRDPFLIMKLRGRTREELVERLEQVEPVSADDAPEQFKPASLDDSSKPAVGADSEATGPQGDVQEGLLSGHEESLPGTVRSQAASVAGPVAAESRDTLTESLQAEPTVFWQGNPVPDDLFGEIQPPPVTAPLLRRLGSLPFWRGSEDFHVAMERIYQAASGPGLEVFLGETNK